MFAVVYDGSQSNRVDIREAFDSVHAPAKCQSFIMLFDLVVSGGRVSSHCLEVGHMPRDVFYVVVNCYRSVVRLAQRRGY